MRKTGCMGNVRMGNVRMGNVRIRMRSIISNKRGDTLVSVLVAFVMIMLVCGIFYRAVMLSNNMIDRAEKLRVETEAALVEYYEATAESGEYEGAGELTFRRAGADDGFTLPGEVSSAGGAGETYEIEYFK